jgi:ABC-type phosphate transport system permease subunit
MGSQLEKINANPATNFKINEINSITDLLTKGGFNIINFVFFIAGVFFLFNLITAAWEYVNSYGDQKRIQGASSRLTNAFFGIVIVLGSFLLVTIFTSVLGINSPLN